MQNLNSIFASNIQHMDDNEIDDLKNVPMSAVINTETAFLAFRSPWDRDYPNRPYLHILGSLQQLNGTLPYDITGIYTQHNTTRVDAFYEFTNDQLSDLVKKGLYERGFEVPEQIKESQLEVDVNCDFKIIKPDKARDVDFPIVFAQVNNLRNLQLTQENSGYDLAEYFEKAKTFNHSYQEANDYQVTANLPEINETKQAEPVPQLPKDDMLDFTDHSLDLDDGITADVPKQNEPESLATDASDLTVEKHDDSTNMDHETKENKTVAQNPNPVQFGKSEKSDANDLIKKARERIAKRKAKIAEQNKIKKQKTEKKKQQQVPVDTTHTDDEYRNSVRVNQVNNEQAELQNKGILQETIPETASDFDNINDEKLDKTAKKSKSKKQVSSKMSPIKAPSVNSKSVDDDYTL